MDDSDPNWGIEQFFDGRGRWEEGAAPRAWNDPETAIAQRQFWEILRSCLAELPPRTAEVFYLREVLGQPVENICKSLEITQRDCSAMLLSARLRLRAGLEAKWFAGGRAEH